tara:strand:- start:98 stop:277 length:180 start_codon:yes stop_codon:yes gene_type:complete
MIHFNEKDMARLEKACETYRDQTGSEYMWDEYTELIHKLKNYEEEIECPDCVLCSIHSQ